MNRFILILIFVFSYSLSKSQIGIKYLNGFIWLNNDNKYHLTIEASNKNIIKDFIIVSSDKQIIKPDSLGKFIYCPIDTCSFKFTLNVCKIVKSDTIKLNSRDFTLLPFPSPTTCLSTKNVLMRRYGKITKKDLLCSNIRLTSDVLNYDFSLSCVVTSFSLMIIRNRKMILDKKYIGNEITEKEVIYLKRKIRLNDEIIFYNIAAKTNKYSDKYLNSINLKIKE